MRSKRTAESVISSRDEKRKMRLAKIELLHFGGDLKNCLGFWSQFLWIHTAEDLVRKDKFHYLLQCMMQENLARKIIQSFPQIAGHYEKAIEAL